MSSILTHQTSASSEGEGNRLATGDWDLQRPPTRTLGALKNSPMIVKTEQCYCFCYVILDFYTEGVFLVKMKNAFDPVKRIHSLNTYFRISTVPRWSERSE